MFNKMKVIGGASLLALSFGANAAPVDLFSTNQGAYTDNTKDGTDTGTIITSGPGGSVGVADPTILGGNRDLFVSKISDNNGDQATRSATASVSGGVFDFSTSTGTTGRAQIQWDGAEATNAIDHTGLGGLDLTFGGTQNAFSIGVVFSDAGFNFKITAYTDATNYTEVTITSNAHDVPATTSIPFSAFLLGSGSYLGGTVVVNQVGAGGDLTKLGALVVDIDQFGLKTSLDLTLDQVTTVPEPSVLGLMGIGLLAAGYSRGKKAKLAV
ncbi:PEP-CTERM sorting domain-containing protein [Methylomonas sp. EFPC3]|uniref:PEP-CTERM sorting domain-containing protein n=1 Tax=Methylomonas sp. EFPC3 TaxID=3021710 RepID=UPI0024166FCF|nr:PEP-CTERM sorting domain-containing protein [Methylomonas sp. EFPC3]WFP50753.1 PEP-CTERM sorting domain-containing protein [Methylomonas sp. EFPC3]